MQVPQGTKLWSSVEWSRDWGLWESEDFTNGEKAVIGWLVAHAEIMDVKHAHTFIGRGVNVSRSVVARTMAKLTKMGAAKQVGEQHIALMCHPRHNGVSPATHNRKEMLYPDRDRAIEDSYIYSVSPATQPDDTAAKVAAAFAAVQRATRNNWTPDQDSGPNDIGR